MSRSARRKTLADEHQEQLAKVKDAWTGAAKTSAVADTAAYGAAAAAVEAVTFGDGVSAQYDIVHSLGTLDIVVEVYELATGFTVIPTNVTRLNVNTVRLNFGGVVGVNGFRALINK